MIKIVNGKRCKTLGTYLKMQMPRERREHIKRQIKKVLRTAKEILTTNSNFDNFDSFKYKGGLVTCLNEIKSINFFIVSYEGLNFCQRKWVAELYELALKMEEAIKSTDNMIGSLRAQGNYHGVYNIEKGEN